MTSSSAAKTTETVIELSIAETRILRAKLGLAPLRSAPEDKDEDDDDDRRRDGGDVDDNEEEEL